MRIPSCRFHREDSLVQTLLCGSIVRTPLCGFHCTNSFVRIISCGFHHADSVVRVPSIVLPSCASHPVHPILRIPLCEFYRTNSLVRMPSCAVGRVGTLAHRIAFVFALPLASTGMYQLRMYWVRAHRLELYRSHCMCVIDY